MNLVIIFLAVFIIVLIYILFKYYTNTATTLYSQATLVSSSTPVIITDHPQALRYAIGTWVYIQHWDNTTYKPIFTIEDVFSIYLDPTKPILYVQVVQTTKDDTASIIQVTENFPLQKWTYITVIVDAQYVDIYIDGKMLKSVILPKNPKLPSVDSNGAVNAYLGKTIQGQTIASKIMLSRVKRWPNPLSPQEVWNEYIQGSGSNLSSMFHSYGLGLNLLQDGANAYTYRVL
jgi:Concanavalin A-like lectin/glucanases superfamily